MIYEDENSKIITIKDFWDIFIRRWYVFLLVFVLTVGGLFAFDHYAVTPKYSSTATLYILRQNDQQANDYPDADFSLALKVVNDCSYLLKSHAVADEVMKQTGFSIPYKEFTESVKTENPEDTRILKVTLESDTPEKAKMLVDTLCEIGQEKISEVMGFQQVNLFEYGTLEQKPSNRMNLTVIIFAGITVAILVYGLFLLRFLLDSRLRTDEDIEKYLHLSLLGNIPDTNSLGKNEKYEYYGN